MSFPLSHLDNYKIILASQSPRRKELLSNMGLKFEVRVIKNLDESYPPDIDVLQVAEFLANKKAEAYKPTLNANELIITADTVVICDGNILEKPENSQDAFRMIHNLSGKTHQVITGVSVQTKKQHLCFSSETNVCFDKLSTEEINYYIEHYKPYDKAGAYGIQEWIGHIGVCGIEGSYFNVMGLPVQKLYQTLKEIKH